MHDRTLTSDHGQLAIDLAQSRVGLAALKCKVERRVCRFDKGDIHQAKLLRDHYSQQLNWDAATQATPRTPASDDFHRALRELAGLYRAEEAPLPREQKQLIVTFLTLLDQFIENRLTARAAARLIQLLNRISPLNGAPTDEAPAR